MKNKTNFVYSLLFSVAGLIAIFLVWFIYIKPEATVSFWWVSELPLVNSILNSIAAIFLSLGYYFIKKGDVRSHIKCMSGATATSALFLVSYLAYHHFHGDTKFVADGMVKVAYFSILISHIILSIAMLPMILITLWNAFTSNTESHKKWARWTLPIWLYVSVTGVLIFLFLRFLNY